MRDKRCVKEDTAVKAIAVDRQVRHRDGECRVTAEINPGVSKRQARQRPADFFVLTGFSESTGFHYSRIMRGNKEIQRFKKDALGE